MTGLLAVYVHHHGLGHLHRATTIARQWPGRAVGMGSLPRPTDWPGEWVELARDDEPPFAAPTAGGALHWAPQGNQGHAERMHQIASTLARTAPAVVLVDVSVEVVCLARLLGHRVVMMDMFGEREDEPHRLARRMADAVLAPWPALADDGSRPRWHLGAISRFDEARVPERRSSGGPLRVGVLWGAGGSAMDDDLLAQAEGATPGTRWERVVGSGEEVLRQMSDCDVVVTHGGQNAVAEVARVRRPAVVIAQPRPFGEQSALVAAVSRVGAAVCLDAWPPARDWPGVLADALERDPECWRQWHDGAGAARAVTALQALGRVLDPVPGAVAVVITVHGRHEHLTNQLASLVRQDRRPELVSLVCMDDAQAAAVAERTLAETEGTVPRLLVSHLPVDDGQLPLARARNLGAAVARAAGADRLVFLDVDCIAGAALVSSYSHWLAQPPLAGQVLMGTVRYLPPAPADGWTPEDLEAAGEHHPVRPRLASDEQRPCADARLFWSLSFATTVETWDRAGGFHEGYVGYGGEDTDFAMTCEDRGVRFAWVGGTDAFHQHHASSTPPVEHVASIVRNATLFAERWGWLPMSGWLEEFERRGLVRRSGEGYVLGSG